MTVKYEMTFFCMHAQSKAHIAASWSRCQSERMCAFKPYMRLEKEENSEDSLMKTLSKLV